MALVPNLRGAQVAIKAEVHKITIPVSASAAHSLANVRNTREAMLEEVRSIVARRNHVASEVLVEVGMSTTFGLLINIRNTTQG